MPRPTTKQRTPLSGNHVPPGPHGDGRPLRRDDIVRAAIAIANDEGPQAVSMRRIAAKLGAGTMSLYWHVANKEQLIDLMLDAVAGEVEMPDLPSGDWRRDLRVIATNTRTVLNRHTWLASVIGTWPWFGPNVLRHTERSLAAFDGVGVDLATAMAMSGAVDAYVIGFVLEEFRTRAASVPTMTRSNESGDGDAAAQAEELLATGAFPRVARLLAEGRELDADERFAFGLNCLLDGIAMYVPGTADPSGAGGLEPAQKRQPGAS